MKNTGILAVAVWAIANNDFVVLGGDGEFKYGRQYIGPAALVGDDGRSLVGSESYCQGSAKTIEVELDYCENVDKVFQLGTQDSCCVNPMGGNGTEEAICRSLGIAEPVCSPADQYICSAPGNRFDLTVNVLIDNVDEVTCCASCQCFADPHCQGFQGLEQDWAICDARTLNADGSCPGTGSSLYKQSSCEQFTDGYGNQCKWIGWSSPFYKTNGPCQPANTSDYYPMNMFTTEDGGFALELELGSRGNIAQGQFTFTQANGSIVETSLVAANCFKAWDAGEASLAWTNGIPDSVSWSWRADYNGSHQEIAWNLFDTVNYVNLRVNCATQWNNGQRSPNSVSYRLDVNDLVVYDYQRAMDGSGYCVTNDIGYDKSLVKNNPQTEAIDSRCAFGTNVDSCKTYVDSSCTSSNMDDILDAWCETLFKPKGGFAMGSVAKCQANAKNTTDGARNIVVMFTQAIQFRMMRNWAKIFASLSDGSLNGSDLSKKYDAGRVGTTCVDEWSLYKTIVPADCVPTMTIDFKNGSEWVTLMTIPADQPPCSITLNGTYEEYPELYLYEWRVNECQVPASCYQSCAPIIGFNASVEYLTKSCDDTPAPTHAPTEKPTETPTTSNIPTNNPTARPTENPTILSTPNPTKTPTAKPTATSSPTESPTKSPSTKPTATSSPTESPTSSPTHSPTESPTSKPTDTDSPTRSPTGTDSPTESPTNAPTHSPTDSPTKRPTSTNLPTSSPTKLTNTPTRSPTRQPTLTLPPTMNPTQPFIPNQLCNSTQDNIPNVTNLCNLVTLDDYGACCGYETSETQESTCREMRTNGAWCEASALDQCSSLPPSKIVMNLNLTVPPPPSDMICCKTCQCHGDPECSAFDGNYAAWILCDGRTKGKSGCPITKDQCLTQVDQTGANCTWDQSVYNKVKNSAKMIGVYGSPCRPSMASGYPQMEMYGTGSYSFNVSLGERGVIVQINMATVNGEYEMSAEKCWDAYDQGDAFGAWEVLSGSLKNASFMKVNDQMLSWRVVDTGTGIVSDFSCIRQIINDKESVYPRIDVNTIFEPNVNRTGQGFCDSGVIDIGQATPLDQNLNNYCSNLNSNARVSQILVDPSANSVEDSIMVRRWCDLAMESDLDKQTCFNTIFNQSSNTFVESAWVKYVCSQNNLGIVSNLRTSTIDDCIAQINAIGLEAYVETYGPGYLQKTVPDNRCGTSQHDYSKKNDSNSCQMGISIEYFANGAWEEELFIPTDYPPCYPIDITADVHPNLFLNPVRFRQCDLDEECLIENKCEPVPGFNTQIQYTGCQS